MSAKRPGQASVQYDDVRGEAAADVSDRLSNSLQDVAAKLGLKVRGLVVGIGINGGDECFPDRDTVSVTVQVVDAKEAVDNLNAHLAETDGTLKVKEYTKDDISPADFIRCFKRFEVNLFSRHLKAQQVVCVESISINDKGN